MHTSLARKLRSNTTDVEQILWFRLRNRQIEGVKFRRQHVINHFIVDFVSVEKKLIIEIDGGQHNQDTNKKEDEKRTLFLQKKGFKVLRFWNNELLENIEGVLERIRLGLHS